MSNVKTPADRNINQVNQAETSTSQKPSQQISERRELTSAASEQTIANSGKESEYNQVISELSQNTDELAKNVKKTSKELRQDPDFVQLAHAKIPGLLLALASQLSNMHVREEIWNDDNLTEIRMRNLQCYIQTPETHFFPTEESKNDYHTVLQAVQENGGALQWASDELQNNKDIVFEAIKTFPLAVYFASDDLKDDLDIAKAALERSNKITSTADIFGYFSRNIRSNKELILTYATHHFIFSKTSIEIKSDKEFILNLLQDHPEFILYIYRSLKTDEEFLEKAFETNPETLIILLMKRGRSSELYHWLEQRNHNL